MTGYIDSYYSRSLKNDQDYAPLQETIEADVCVIGGGLAGIATALGLAERGKKAVVLESSRIGYGASGRNGGFVLSGFATDPRDIVKKVGLSHTQEMFGLTRDALKTIRKRIKDYKIECDPVDGYMIASWFDNPDNLKDRAAFFNEQLGENVEFWEREKLRGHLDTDRYFDALLMPDNFHMHPLNYLHGIAAALCEKGGQVYEQTAALDVKDTVSGLIVKTEHGEVRAGDVVYCGSAYFNGIEKKLQRSCLPVRTYVVKTAPIDKDLLNDTIGLPYAIRDNRWADDYYRILPDGSLLWGGRVGLGAEPANLADLMISDIKTIYPQLTDIKAEVAWSGLMGYSVYKMPHIGRFADNIWYCTNFGGNGVGPTTAGGEVIASAIAEHDERYKLYAPFGFAYTGGALGPYVAQTIYRSWEIADKLREWNKKEAAWKRPFSRYF